MKINGLEKRREVFEIVNKNKEFFNNIVLDLLSDKPKYKKSFLEKMMKYMIFY
jgi:hypothetical protein